jgi:hypothetical protein
MPENQSGRPLQLDVAVKKIVPALKPVFTGAGVRVMERVASRDELDRA